MLPDKLKEWNYYSSKLPLFMKNSYGIEDHFYMLYEVLVSLSDIEENIFILLDVMNENYLDNLAKIYNTTNVDATNFVILDQIASIYGISRNFTKNGQTFTNLKNTELLFIIKCRILQNMYDGTYETATKFYKQINLPLLMLNGKDSADCYCYLALYASDIQQKVFKAGLCTLESVGINYSYSITDFNSIGIWDSNNTNRVWNRGRWS